MLILTAVATESRALQRSLRGLNCRFKTIGIKACNMPSPDQLKNISMIILCGLAGGLDPSLKVGDVVLDDAHLIKSSLRRGRIYTADSIVATSIEKQKIFQHTGASAVDMELSIVRQFAEFNQIPLICVRAISDSANEILDPRVIEFVHPLGGLRPLKVATTLAQSPSILPYLFRLNANTKVALNALGAAVRSIVISIQH